MRLAVSPGARATHKKAKEYFESQYPLVEESAKNFLIHPYFTLSIKSDNIAWFDTIGLRMRKMRKDLDRDGSDDFRVEKDRCEMYRFFQRANIPHVKVLGFWESLPDVESAIESGKIWSGVEQWPNFIKMCHLTQGSMKAVLQVKEAAKKDSGTIAAWIRHKWRARSDDWERTWREDGNTLTDSLTPGIMVQEPWHLIDNPYKGRRMPLELKTEVFWGRAYLAVTSDLSRATCFLRDNTTEHYPTLWSQAVFAAEEETLFSKWVIGQGHLECVWRLAERVAKIIGADAVRVDIFLWKDHPNDCVVNEISLSSGMQYSMHYPFLAKAWTLPHYKGLARVFDPKGLRVYQQTPQSVQERVEVVKH